jgi:hypothetical protein
LPFQPGYSIANHTWKVRYSPNIISKVASKYQNSIVSDFFKSTQESLQNLTYKLGLMRENTDGRCNAQNEVELFILFIMNGLANIETFSQERCYSIFQNTKVNAEDYLKVFYSGSLNDLESLSKQYPNNQMMFYGYMIKKKQHEAMTPGGSAKRSMRKNRKIRSILKRVRRSRRNQRRQA